MYQVGDRVVYGIHGVCTVIDREQLVVDRKTVSYLVLEPLGQEGTRCMVPIHNDAAMKKVHPMLTPKTLEAVIHSDEVRADCWNRDENARKQSYRELITSGDSVGQMRMVHTLYQHRKTQIQAGKKVHLADENFLRDVEKLLTDEISVVMDLPVDQARAYLRRELNGES